MRVVVAKDKSELGRRAAAHGAELIRAAISARGRANIIVATGASQFEMLAELSSLPDIDWPKITGFHLDEYVGLPIDHPASFRGYLWKRFLSQLPLPTRTFHFVDGEAEPEAECKRLGALIARHPIDVAFVGIGENGHLAFNDPPADFATPQPYLVVRLDDACRRQQMGEGWFATVADVPERAISMSCRQIMASSSIVCSVPDLRKAQAVVGAVEGPVTQQVPASILQRHADATIFLDTPAASLLTR